MIVIAGEVKINPEKREEAIRLGLWMSQKSEAETGCLQYRFYSDLEKPDTILIFERWESELALQTHFHTPHMAEFQEKLPGILAGEMEIYRYDAETVTRL